MISTKITEALQSAYKFQTGHQVPSSVDVIHDYLRIGGTWIAQINWVQHKWWETYTVISRFQINHDQHVFIGFEEACCNGDLSPYELGYVFNQDSIAFYEQIELKTIAKDYKRIQEDENCYYN